MPKLDLTPSKHIFDALAQDINTERAISDLVDNAIDNAKIQGQTTLRVEVSFDEARVKVLDHSGGVDLEFLPLLLRPGGTRGGGSGIKGIWGVGAKRAMFSLGRRLIISTRKTGSVGYVIDTNEAWFQEDQATDKWQIDYNEDAELEEGVTSIRIEELKVPADPLTVLGVRKYLARTYRDEIGSGTIQMVYNGEIISLIPEVPWAKSAYAQPSTYITDIPVGNDHRGLHFEMTVGVMTEPGEDYSYGIDLVGNRRVILHNNLDARMGFDKDRLGSPHPTINRFRAIVRVSGESQDIPWNSAKSDVNTNHPMYVPIVDLVVQVSRQYVSFLRKNYDVTLRLFREPALVTDIVDVPFDYGREFRRVVRPYEEPKREKGISFKVPEEDYVELVNHFGLALSTQRQVGLFLFKRVLMEIRDDADN